MTRRLMDLALHDIYATSVMWDIDWREQSSGATLAGHRNILIGALPRWIANIDGETFRTDIGRLRARTLAGRGMTGIFRVRMCDPAVFNGTKALTTFSDGATFSDGSRFSEWPFVLCAEAAAVGSTSILLDPRALTLRVGQIMSYNDWPFAVTSLMPEGGNLRAQVEMPLRTAIPQGAIVQAVGRGLFEMVSPMQGQQSYAQRLVAQPSFRLQEWLR